MRASFSKETFEAVEIEMAARSNVELGEDGKLYRKSKKYSSKGKIKGRLCRSGRL